MKTLPAVLLITLILATAARSQDSAIVSPEQFGLNNLTEYLNLKPSDISFRSDYTEPDSFRLKVVADLMREPLKMIDYTSGLRQAHVKKQPEVLAGMLFKDLAGEYQKYRGRPYQASAMELEKKYDLYYTNLYANRILSKAAVYLNVIFPKSTQMLLGNLTPAQRAFLRKQFKELVTMDEKQEFMTVDQLDSLDKIQEKYTDTLAMFGLKIDKDPIIAAGIDCLRELMLEINAIRMYLDSSKENAAHFMTHAAYLPSNVKTDNYLGKQPGWAIGGPGDDTYKGDYYFILDIGGNDTYELTYNPANPHGCIIIDLGGDDHYVAKSDFTIGSGCFSNGFVLDFGGGNDRYDAKSFGLGSGYFGLGLLYDDGGDDRYDGDTHVEGAASFGLGILIDETGRDIYNAAVYAQGFGFVQGIGMLYDMEGSDSYYAGGKYKDVLRYEDHFLSMSQGFGLGMRPTISGGIGALIDLKGFDTYYADIFAQGTSYWWSLGVLYDSSGNDSYQAYQYAQGCATHMSLGCLIDDWGNDVYFGKGLMQGVGHDYSCGLILDRHGNDTYTAYDLSQGAGSANGAGVLMDCQGDDRYFVKNPKNTQGFGDPRRDYGSIGLFIDLGGSDQYWGNGKDNSYWRTNSRWGGGMDIELKPKDSTQATR